MKDKDLNFEESEASHTLGGVGRGHVSRGEKIKNQLFIMKR
jgi:hypothetical protein